MTRTPLPRPIDAPAWRVTAALVAAAVALTAAGCGTLATRRADPAPTAAASMTPSAPSGVRWLAAGALFSGPADNPGEHHCSASVVDSPTGDLVMTAGHCVADGDGTPPRTGFSFIPGYHDRAAPFGIWTVTAAYVDDAWRDRADPAHDVAFIRVARPGAPPIQQLTGAYHIRLHPDPATAVDAIGYPDFSDVPQIRSGTTDRFSPTQLVLPAHGLYDGTSGGPWLRAPTDTDLIGVTGGYQQGGLDPETSYATYLGDDAAALLTRAAGTP